MKLIRVFALDLSRPRLLGVAQVEDYARCSAVSVGKRPFSVRHRKAALGVAKHDVMQLQYHRAKHEPEEQSRVRELVTHPINDLALAPLLASTKVFHFVIRKANRSALVFVLAVAVHVHAHRAAHDEEGIPRQCVDTAAASQV